jgi:PadR family transcriptional regulator, regulatory protein PadR
MENEPLDNLVLELRRGVIVLAVLSQLFEEQYGYSLLKNLADKGFDIDQGTLYPLLRRLESQGLLQSMWRTDDSHPRRYYKVSPQGKEFLPLLKGEWENLSTILGKLLS